MALSAKEQARKAARQAEHLLKLAERTTRPKVYEATSRDANTLQCATEGIGKVGTSAGVARQAGRRLASKASMVKTLAVLPAKREAVRDPFENSPTPVKTLPFYTVVYPPHFPARAPVENALIQVAAEKHGETAKARTETFERIKRDWQQSIERDWNKAAPGVALKRNLRETRTQHE